MTKGYRSVLVTGIFFILLIFAGLLFFNYADSAQPLRNYLYRNDFKKADEIAVYLNSNVIFSRRINCWDVGSRCGVQLIFSTKLTYADVKNKVEQLGYKTILSGSSDGNAVYTLLDIDAGTQVVINGNELTTSHYLQRSKYEGWSWLLSDINDKHYTIAIYDIHSVDQEVKVDNKRLNDNLMVVTVYTKR